MTDRRAPPTGDDDTLTPSAAGVTATAPPEVSGSASTGVADAPLPPGARSRPPMPARLGRYDILGELGAGGMGVVYKGRDPTLGRPLAIKLIRPRARGAEGRARFLREAQAMARLHHPHVVPVFDVGESGDQVYLVMPLLLGGTLATWLRAARRSWREVVDRFLAAARGLAAAHAAGMIHRDFKPENVLLGEAGEVQVADFGLARLGDGDDAALADTAAGTPGSLELTRAGAVLGTPVYMAPEQLRCDAVDARADVFAFCVSLYEGLYGIRPFAAPAGARGQAALDALLAAIERGEVVDPPADREVPAWLHAIVVRGLRAAPADRWPSIAAVIRELERHLAPRRRAWVIPAVAAAALAVAGVAVAVTRGGGGDPTPAAPLDAPALADEPDDALAARCDARDGAACHALAVRLTRRLDTPPDLARVFALALAACDLGVADGCAVIARAYEDGAGIPHDDARARRYAERACRGGSGLGCLLQGLALDRGSGGPEDRDGALAAYRDGCTHGEPRACEEVAKRLRRSLRAADPAAAAPFEARMVELARQRCDAGDPSACEALGMFHYMGLGVEQDQARGAAILRGACDDGEASACTNLAQLVHAGSGVAADPERAVALLRRACDAGFRRACDTLGIVLGMGLGVAADVDAARALLDEVCRHGGPRYCTTLANLHSMGRVVPKDLARATQLWTRACDAGEGFACQQLAIRQDDPAAAQRLLERSCTLGVAMGCDALGAHAATHGDLALSAAAYRAACAMQETQSCAGYADLLFEGKGVERDPARGRAVLEESCRARDFVACDALARRLRDGDGVPRDPLAAHDAFRDGCDLGMGRSCVALADMLERGDGVAADPDRAATLRARACQLVPKFCPTE